MENCSISWVGPVLCLHPETTANGKCKRKDYKEKISSAMLECKVLKCARVSCYNCVWIGENNRRAFARVHVACENRA